MVDSKGCTILDETASYTFEEFCEMCRLNNEQVQAMINEGILTPVGATPKNWLFTGASVKKVQVAISLQEDLGVNLPGAALAIDLLEELEELRAKNR